MRNINEKTCKSQIRMDEKLLKKKKKKKNLIEHVCDETSVKIKQLLL